MKKTPHIKTGLKLSSLALPVLLAASLPARGELGEGLVEYWRLDGDFSAEVNEDHAGTLEATGIGQSESGFVSGKFGEGIDLESDSSYQSFVVIGGDENDFDFAGGSMSVSLWYTTESLYTQWQTLVGKGENNNWRLARNRGSGNQLKLYLTIIGDGELDQQDGSWHHAVATIDAVEGNRLYVDGELVAENAGPSNLTGNGTPMQIGGNPQAANRAWDGIIDDVAVWDRALTEEEVASIWNGGAGASIASLIGIGDMPFSLAVTSSGPDLVFEWESQPGMLYNLRTSSDLAADLATWESVEVDIEGSPGTDIPATPPLNTQTIARPSDPSRFYLVEEFPAPPMTIFSDDFESGQGAWTTGSDGDPGSEWELGTPSVVGPPAANSGENCFGTDLDDAYEFNANVWLRSPVIDLTGAAGATLSYAEFKDIEPMFDSGTINVLNAADDSFLVEVASGIEGQSSQWDTVGLELPAEALDKMIKIEFRLQSDDFTNFTGWYIDDVVVTTPAQ